MLIWGPDVLRLVREGSYQIERVRSRLAQIVIGAVGSLESRVLRSTIPLLLCGDTISLLGISGIQALMVAI